jgi:pilus assembly protein CpaC
MSFIPTVAWLHQKGKIKRLMALTGGILPLVYGIGWLLVWWQSSSVGGEPAQTILRILPPANQQPEVSSPQERSSSEENLGPSKQHQQNPSSGGTVLSILSESKEASRSAHSPAGHRLILPVLLVTKQGPPVDKAVPASGESAEASAEKSAEKSRESSGTQLSGGNNRPAGGNTHTSGGNGGPTGGNAQSAKGNTQTTGASQPDTAGSSLRMREVPEEAGKVPHAPPPPGFAEVSHEPVLQVVVADGAPVSDPKPVAVPAAGQEPEKIAGVQESPRIRLALPAPSDLHVQRPSLSQARTSLGRSEPSPPEAKPVQAESSVPEKAKPVQAAGPTSSGAGAIPSRALVMSKETKPVDVGSSKPGLTIASGGGSSSAVPSAMLLSSSLSKTASGPNAPPGGPSSVAASGGIGTSGSQAADRPSPSALAGPILPEVPSSGLSSPMWPMLTVPSGAAAVPVPAPTTVSVPGAANAPPSRIALLESEPGKAGSEPGKAVPPLSSASNPSAQPAAGAQTASELAPATPPGVRSAPASTPGTESASTGKTAGEPSAAAQPAREPAPAKAASPQLPTLPTQVPLPKASEGPAKASAGGAAGMAEAESPPKPAGSQAPGATAPSAPPGAGGETSPAGTISPPVRGAPAGPGPLVDTRQQPAQWHRPTAEITQLGPFEVRGHTDELKVVVRRSKILRTKVDIYRVSVVDPAVCDVVQFTPRELAIIGRSQGATDVTFWFADQQYEPITYLVRVIPDPELQQRREEQYGILEDVLAELFPESKVKLIPVADKLIVKGQARDAEEAAQIMAIIRGQMVYPRYQEGYGLLQGQAAPPLAQDPQSAGLLPAMQVINMLYIPGVQQVALKVKIAELNRSAARKFGVDMDLNFVWEDGLIAIKQLLNLASSTAVVSGTFDNERLQFGIHYLQQHGVMRILSEPTLVTLSGRPATFVAGGEFAVPTTVGVAGAAAVTTDFRAFGAIITFLPVVLDKDLIRLEVAPEFSRINRENTVNGTPGLDTRAVTTTVELREGQTLAIAGLLEDSMNGDNASNIPLFGQIFGKRNMNRNETELIILVTPELIHPMEPEEVPPLPGFDVTEPTNLEFYLKGRLEGRPTHEYRSTVWPRLRHRYQAGGPATISGPFGHSK